MSRTFRRKGYENEIFCYGSKIAGYYTESVIHYFAADPENGFDRSTYSFSYREPTKEEYCKKFWKLHSDSHRNDYTPSREYRKTRMVENRSINKREINKWIKNNDYEPLFEANPRSHTWDWD